MNEEKLKRILALKFRQKKPRPQAKETLRRRLFSEAVLSEDDLYQVAAAGTFTDEIVFKNRRKK